jgi:hypothetical protein
LTIVTVVMMESPLCCTAPSNRVAVAGSPGPTWHARTQTDPSPMSALTLVSPSSFWKVLVKERNQRFGLRRITHAIVRMTEMLGQRNRRAPVSCDRITVR